MKYWPLMRNDLGLTRNDHKGETRWLVRDPVSREFFKFGSEEMFLLKCLDGEKGPDETIAGFEQRFKMQLSLSDLDEFIGMVDGWGLLTPDDTPDEDEPFDASDMIEDLSLEDLGLMPDGGMGGMGGLSDIAGQDRMGGMGRRRRQ